MALFISCEVSNQVRVAAVGVVDVTKTNADALKVDEFNSAISTQ
jgi:hypothetical protein